MYSVQSTVHSPQLRIKDFAHKVGDFATALEMTGQFTIHNAQCTINRNERKARGVPVFGRDCRVALRAPRNDKRGVVLLAIVLLRNFSVMTYSRARNARPTLTTYPLSAIHLIRTFTPCEQTYVS
ncbi:MAG: hypothetical protein LBL66_04415 [Clostridiales bacterium]|nr:hypothetical protein [Clostridiales bacterium]